MSALLEGQCHCGNIAVRAEFTGDLTSYETRACDCDFCRMHDAAWVSDPDGRLRFRVTGEGSLRRYRQGAGLADMLFCSQCGVLVGAVFDTPEGFCGVANSRVFAEAFGAETVVTPKQLGPGEKADRWQRIWFKAIRFDE